MSESTPMNVEVKRTDELRPYHRNPMDHPDEQIAELKDSIRKFGFQNPLIVDEGGEIISGHARFKAVQELTGELDETITEARENGNDALASNLERVNGGKIYAIVERGLSDEEKQEFRISDNKVSELSDWEDEKLKFELRELETAVGFSNDELDSMLETNVDYDDLEDDVVEDTGEEIEEHFEELGSEDRNTMLNLVCPHCKEGYQLEASEVERKIERERED